MKFVRYTIVWVVIAYLTAILLNAFARWSEDSSIFGGVVVATLLIIFIRKSAKMKRAGTPLTKQVLADSLTSSIVDGTSTIKSFKSTIQNRIEDRENQVFALAEREVEEHRQDPGLWSKALVMANGNEALRKTEYMKLRAKQVG